MPPLLNETLIALIPKQLGLESLSHYRSISLYNTIYKIVTKILALRMKHLMPNQVSPSQTAFVAGRRGIDNVIVKVKAYRDGPSFSHMFFANDLLLFAKATSENCEAITDVLEEFCSFTGQKISKEK